MPQDQIEMPDDFSAGSRELVTRLNGKFQSADLLKKTIAFGTALTALDDPLVGNDLPHIVEGMASIDGITLRAIRDDIGLFRIEPGFQKLPANERKFWEDLDDALSDPKAWYNSWLKGHGGIGQVR